MNIVDSILFHCQNDPEAPAICIPGVDLITYGRLEKAINNIVRRATSAGLLPGHVVALHVPDKAALHAVLVLGLARLGVITATVGARKLPASFKIDAILSDGPHVFPGIMTIPVDYSWVEGDGSPLPTPYAAKSSDVTRLILTSGTTGEAKAVAWTHDMILGRIMRYYSVFGNKLPSCSRIFCDMTLATSIGFTFFIYTLCKGGTFFMRGNNAENTFRALAFYKVDGMVAAPAGLAEFLGYYDQHHYQHVFDAIVTTGSLLSKPLADRVHGRMSSTVISAYGSAEMGIVACASTHRIGPTGGAVGYITPGMAVEVADESGRLCAAGEEGIIRIQGDYMANGYANDRESTGQFFRGGWFYPGDTGRLTEDRLLILTGRQNAVLNLGGEKVKPELIENTLASFEGGIAAGAFLVTNELGADEIWAAFESALAIDEDKLWQHCRKNLPDFFVPKKFIAVRKLPRNEMGKLDRKQLAKIAGLK